MAGRGSTGFSRASFPDRPLAAETIRLKRRPIGWSGSIAEVFHTWRLRARTSIPSALHGARSRQRSSADYGDLNGLRILLTIWARKRCQEPKSDFLASMCPQQFRAGWPQGIAPLGLPQIRTCTFAHTAPHIMSSLRDGSLSESALRLVPDAATVVVSWTRLWVSMHPPCFPPTVS